MKNLRVLALLTALSLCACLFAGCGQTVADHSAYPSAKTEKGEAWTTPTDESVILEKGDIRLTFDTATTHFTVTDLKKNVTYPSIPTGEAAGFSDDIKERMRSEVTVTYYEEQSNAMYMFSGANSVEFGNFEIMQSADAIRVYYHMSLSADVVFAPQVLDAETYENTILGAVDDPNIARRLGRFYTLYDKKDKPNDWNEQVKLFPILEKTPLYILSSSANDVEKEEISEYMEDAGYTAEKYEKLLSDLKIEGVENEVPVGFTVPVEYKITEDGFTAQILSDEIKENTEIHKLQTITLLEYFAATDQSVNGYYVIPDGAGAVVNLNTTGTSDFRQAFYGADESVKISEKTQLTKNLTLPIFGVSHGTSGVLAIVENAAEVGTLNIGTVHNFSPRNHIYVDFCYRHMDATDVGELMQIPVYNLFSKHLLRIAPKVRYVLLGSDECNYTSMAGYYRNYLLENDGIKQNKTEKAPLELSFLCSIKKDATFIGIPYRKEIVLSTIKEITSTVIKLQEKGIGPINVRLLGYTDNGVAHGAYNKFSLNRSVGSKDELLTLIKTVEDGGGRLYLDADFQYVYADSKSSDFSVADDSAHYLNRALVRNGNHDTVTRGMESATLKKYFVSATRYEDYSSKYIKSAEKKLGNVPALSYASAGQYLGGDYTSKKDIDRAMSLYHLDNALKAAAKQTELVFENGNAYVLPYASTILNVPLFSSRFDLEEHDIPLYQMVVHGLVSYSGTPCNLSVSPVENYLRSIEYGANLSYILITRGNDLLVNTEYETKTYSVSVNGVMDTILTQYNEASAHLNAVAGAAMLKNVTVADGVQQTVYDNGHGVYVNYGKEDKEVNGTLVKAGAFTAY